MKIDGRVPRRIVFIGAECTGKSTIARSVAERLGEPFSTEYVREYVDQLERPLCEKDLEPIARGQIRLEDAAVEKASEYVIHDTNLLSSILYAEHYFDTHIEWVDDVFRNRTYDTYFLCQPDFPWEADPGQRESSGERDDMQTHFQAVLEKYRVNYQLLVGSVEDRLEAVFRTLSCRSE